MRIQGNGNRHMSGIETIGQRDLKGQGVHEEQIISILKEISKAQNKQSQQMSSYDQSLSELENQTTTIYNTIPIQFISRHKEDTLFWIRGYKRLMATTFLSASTTFFRVIDVCEATSTIHLELLFSSMMNETYDDGTTFQTIEDVVFTRTGIFISVNANIFDGIICLPAVYASEARVN